MLDGIAQTEDGGEDVVFIRHYALASTLEKDLERLGVTFEERELVLLDTEDQLIGPQIDQLRAGITVLSESAWRMSGENRRHGKFFCRFASVQGCVYPLDRVRPHPMDEFPFDDTNLRRAERKGIPIFRLPLCTYADAFKALNKVWHPTHGGYCWLANALETEEQLLANIMTLCTPSLRVKKGAREGITLPPSSLSSLSRCRLSLTPPLPSPLVIISLSSCIFS